MRLLFDTQILLWAAGAPGRLPGEARRLLEDPETVPVFSPASLWGVTITRALPAAS